MNVSLWGCEAFGLPCDGAGGIVMLPRLGLAAENRTPMPAAVVLFLHGFQLMGVDAMASLSKELGRDSWKLRWYDSDNKRKAIRLGSMPKKSAESFRIKFEQLLEVRRAGDSLPAALSQWLDSIDAELRERIVNTGLLESKRRLTLGRFCDEFIESRSNVADATTVRDKQVCDRLIERFGRDRLLDSITVRDAEDWRRWLATDGNKRDTDRATLGDNTVRRRIGVARQIFATAIRWKLLSENPFAGMATTVRENLERRAFVSWSDILRVIEVAGGSQWKALIAFVRLTGCRVPSELTELRWSDIDFIAKRVVIRSPKTKHHGGDHAMRSVPLFPELMPYLREWADEVGPGIEVALSSPVFPMASDPRVNLRTQLARLIVKAGLVPWEKMFVNLRSSRETELLAVYPAADVCRWFGHSPAVAARFYAQARPEVADRASIETTVKGALLGSEMGPIGSETGSKTGPIADRQKPATNHLGEKKTQRNIGSKMVSESSKGALDGPPEWAILDSNDNENPREIGGRVENGVQNGACYDPRVDELLSIYSALDAAQREALLNVARGIAAQSKGPSHRG